MCPLSLFFYLYIFFTFRNKKSCLTLCRAWGSVMHCCCKHRDLNTANCSNAKLVLSAWLQDLARFCSLYSAWRELDVFRKRAKTSLYAKWGAVQTLTKQNIGAYKNTVWMLCPMATAVTLPSAVRALPADHTDLKWAESPSTISCETTNQGSGWFNSKLPGVILVLPRLPHLSLLLKE